MGTLFRPKGFAPVASGGSDLWQRPIPGLALRLRVDPEDLRPLGPPLLLDEVVVDGSAFLHPVQGLYVRGHARPRSIAVRAPSRCSAPQALRPVGGPVPVGASGFSACGPASRRHLAGPIVWFSDTLRTAVALVRGLERSCRVQRRVRHRHIAEGLRGVRVKAK